LNNPFSKKNIECFLTCARGLENITSTNIDPFCDAVSVENGGVQFTGDMRSLYNVNMHSRTGMHALVKILDVKARSNDELYKEVVTYPWYEWITPADTIFIRTRIRSRYFDNSQYTSLKVKDAIVDCIRKKVGSRPDVDKANPRYSLFLFIAEDKVTIYLNSSGESLSKRGYREKIHKASLNEALAAGIILLSDWKVGQPLYDPMCGSGTFPLEAALISRNIPAGYYKKKFAFQKWHHFDNRLWNGIVKSVREKIVHDRFPIYGYDNVNANIRLSKDNSRRILIHNYVQFKNAEFSEFNPENPGTIIINPPYGERLDEESNLQPLYELMGDILKQNCQNSNVYILSGNPNLAKHIGLQPKSKTVLKNGKIDCRLLHFPIRGGKYVD
tara:strand:+ start:2365 stop:3522 length:1158 start_codon:yes stop_codon:yes gene_type:complete